MLKKEVLMREKGNSDSKVGALKIWLAVFATMMAFALTCAVAMPNFGISAVAAGLEIVHCTYYNGNPPKLAVKYKDPNNRTMIDLWAVSKTPENGDLKITINGQQYYAKFSQLVNSSDIKDNGDGTKTISMPADDKMKVFSKPAAGTNVTIWMATYDSSNPSIKDEVMVDLTVPPENKSTDDALTATPPTGETKYFNNDEWQVGVKEGAGYKLSGQYAAAKAGTYTATATLQSGYKWTDGTTAPKEIAWELKPAEIAGVTVAVWGAEDFTYTPSLSPLLYTKVTFANGYATGQSLQYNWNNKIVENIHLAGHKPGNYTVTVTGANSNVTGSATAKYTITKNKGKFSAKARSLTSTIKKDTNKKKIVDINEFINIKNADKLTFKKLEGNENIKIDSKKQDIVLKKGLKPGTYSVKVKITSKSDGYAYKKASQTVKFKIKVKGKK